MRWPLALFVFVLLLLGLPIQVDVYTEVGNELGIVHNWLWFGGGQLVYYVTQPVLFPSNYVSFQGDLRVVPNIIFLIVGSLIGTLVISFLLKSRKN